MSNFIQPGKQDPTYSGKVSLEKSDDRLVLKDASNKIIALFGKDDAGDIVFKFAQDGYDARTATDDQLTMSSQFNLHKIVADGAVTAGARVGTLNLTTTYVGYRSLLKINTGITSADYRLDGKAMLRVYKQGSLEDARLSGIYYDDGTNKLCYQYDYYMGYDVTEDTYVIYIDSKIRLLAGSLTITPTDIISGDYYWEICNNTQSATGGAGGGGGGSGKYIYTDTITYDKDGNIISALASSTDELTTGLWGYFPKHTYV